MGTNLRSPEADYTFRLLGRQGKFYSLRAPIWNTINRNSLDAQQFESEVAGFLMDHADGEWHLSCFKFVDGYEPMLDALDNAKSLCVLIESEKDFDKFKRVFNVRGD